MCLTTTTKNALKTEAIYSQEYWHIVFQQYPFPVKTDFLSRLFKFQVGALPGRYKGKPGIIFIMLKKLKITFWGCTCV